MTKRLPAETLLEIFHYYLHLPETIRTWTQPTVCHSRHTFTSPIILTHVCRFWREVACNDPRLWSSIFVIGPTLNQIPLVRLWLSRTGNFTLRIEFLERFCESSSKNLTIASHELLNVFWEKKRFWEIIDFEFASILDEHSNWMLREAVANPDPELEVYSARIIDNRMGHKDLTLPLWQTVPWCPRLQRLEVGVLFFPTLNVNLRELVCHGPQTRAQILRFLAGCPRLEKFEGTVVRGTTEENPWARYPQGTLVHSELRHLCLNSFGDVISLAIYDALVCPRLEFFSADLNGGNRDCARGMYEFIERSQCRLRTLKGVSVNHLTQDLDAVTRYFSHPLLQDLETLLVHRPTQNFFRALTLPTPHPSGTRNPPALLPRLKDLDIVCYRAATGVEFSQMIVSRFEHLKQVRLSGTPPDTVLLEGHRVWGFPGIVIDVVRDFSKRDKLWSDYTLFGGAWDQKFLDYPMAGAQPLAGEFFLDRFGRGNGWYKSDRFYVLIDGRSAEGRPRRGRAFQLSDDV